MSLAERKHNRLKTFDYSQNGAYFITICSKNKKCLFARIVGATIGRPPTVELTPYGVVIEDAIERSQKIYPSVNVDKYVIMPNHVHLLISICGAGGRSMIAPTISRVVQQMKGYATKQAGLEIWQKSFHDHVIRNQKDYDMIWQYIDTNPARWEQDCFYMEG